MHLSFRIGDRTYPAHSICALSGKKLPVSESDFRAVIASVKGQCRDAADLLRLELDLRCPEVELMNALGVVFPQYWLQPNCDDLFPMHVKTLREHYAVCRTVNLGSKEEPNMQQVDALIDGRALSLQSSLFKLTMKSHCKSAMEEPHGDNPVTKL